MKIIRKRYHLKILYANLKRHFFYNGKAGFGKTGFTLIELLLAAALFSLVLTAGFSFYFFGDYTYQKGMAQSDLQQNIRLSLDFICRDLRNAEDVSLISSLEISYKKPGDSNSYRIMKKNDEIVLFINYTETKIAYGIKELIFTLKGNDLIRVSITGGEEEQDYKLQTIVRAQNMR